MKRKTERLEGEMKALKRIDFVLLAPEAQNVFLAGDFNGWDVHSYPLKKDSNGTWKISIDLKPGRYEYRFIVDGVWQIDPNCTSFAPNLHGGKNCVLTVEMDAISKEKKFVLDEIILKIVSEMKPISSENVFWEIGENVNLESKPSQTEVNQRLEKMEKEGMLERIRLKSEKGKYTVIEGSQFDEFFCYPEYWVLKGESVIRPKSSKPGNHKKRYNRIRKLAEIMEDKVSKAMHNRRKLNVPF